MKTFKEWLADYNKEHGVPPASVMAEAAWEFSHTQTKDYVLRCCGYDVVTGDSDLKKQSLD